MRRAGMQDSDIMEVAGWSGLTMLKRYVASEATDLAAEAHGECSPAGRLSGGRSP